MGLKRAELPYLLPLEARHIMLDVRAQLASCWACCAQNKTPETHFSFTFSFSVYFLLTRWQLQPELLKEAQRSIYVCVAVCF